MFFVQVSYIQCTIVEFLVLFLSNLLLNFMLTKEKKISNLVPKYPLKNMEKSLNCFDSELPAKYKSILCGD